MLKSLRIQNFKSIVDDTIELGRINVFIGENGCGKSNILEAVAVLGSAFENSLNVENLYSKGVRIAKPELMRNSFAGQPKRTPIGLDCTITISHANYAVSSQIRPTEDKSVFAEWYSSNDFSSLFQLVDEEERRFRQILEHVTTSSDSYIPPTENKRSQKRNQEQIATKSFERILRMMLRDRTAEYISFINSFLIYNLSTKALRGIYSESKKTPVGINGENLDVLISTFTSTEIDLLKESIGFISWFNDIVIDADDILKFEGHKLGKSISTLYFKDKYMKRGNNIFSAENANEGILHILFYLSLFISDRTPEFFAIDNIETALNPQLCRELIKKLSELSRTSTKQALITTHNPAILDGLNLNDDDQRLFVVYRTDEGHTKTRRIKAKINPDNNHYKLSELWMRGHLGGLPNTF